MKIESAKAKVRYYTMLQDVRVTKKFGNLKRFEGNFDVHSKITKSGIDSCVIYAIWDENPTEKKLIAHAIKEMAKELQQFGYIL